MKNDKPNNTAFDAMLQKAVAENFEQKLTALDNAELAEKYSFSSRHEARMQKLFRKERSRRTMRTIAIAAKRTAAVVLMFAVFSSGVIMLNADVRARVINIFTETRKEGNLDVVSFTRTGDSPDYDARWAPSYLPFELAETYNSHTAHGHGTYAFLTYSNPDHSVGIGLIISSIPHTSSYVQNDNHLRNTVRINGEEAFLFTPIETNPELLGPESSTAISLLWQQDGFAFDLYSNADIDIDELIKIAESVAVVQ